jgi:hypothetical protein
MYTPPVSSRINPSNNSSLNDPNSEPPRADPNSLASSRTSSTATQLQLLGRRTRSEVEGDPADASPKAAQRPRVPLPVAMPALSTSYIPTQTAPQAMTPAHAPGMPTPHMPQLAPGNQSPWLVSNGWNPPFAARHQNIALAANSAAHQAAPPRLSHIAHHLQFAVLRKETETYQHYSNVKKAAASIVTAVESAGVDMFYAVQHHCHQVQNHYLVGNELIKAAAKDMLKTLRLPGDMSYVDAASDLILYHQHLLSWRGPNPPPNPLESLESLESLKSNQCLDETYQSMAKQSIQEDQSLKPEARAKMIRAVDSVFNKIESYKKSVSEMKGSPPVKNCLSEMLSFNAPGMNFNDLDAAESILNLMANQSDPSYQEVKAFLYLMNIFKDHELYL